MQVEETEAQIQRHQIMINNALQWTQEQERLQAATEAFNLAQEALQIAVRSTCIPDANAVHVTNTFHLLHFTFCAPRSRRAMSHCSMSIIFPCTDWHIQAACPRKAQVIESLRNRDWYLLLDHI